MTTLPLVTYIIPTRNRPQELSRCLASVQQQDYADKQIIVINNASSEESDAIVRQHAPTAEYLTLSENIGAPAARNRGISMADGEILIFLDDDAEFVDPQATRRAVHYFYKRSDLAGVAFRIVNPNTGREARNAIPRADKHEFLTDYACAYFCHCGCAFRRSVFDEVGLFWEALEYGGEELDFSYRVLERHYTLIHSASVSVRHWESHAARPPGRWYYVNARNRIWITVKYLPWPAVISTMSLWWTYLLLRSVMTGQAAAVLRGIRDALAGFPALLRERRPLSKAILREVRNLSGRFWY